MMNERKKAPKAPAPPSPTPGRERYVEGEPMTFAIFLTVLSMAVLILVLVMGKG